MFRKYYVLPGKPLPNLAGHLVLEGLTAVVSPEVAEKVVVSLYMVLLPLGVRYGVRSIRRRATPLAWVAFAMAYNYLYSQGFYNFVLSCGVFFSLWGIGSESGSDGLEAGGGAGGVGGGALRLSPVLAGDGVRGDWGALRLVWVLGDERSGPLAAPLNGRW